MENILNIPEFLRTWGNSTVILEGNYLVWEESAVLQNHFERLVSPHALPYPRKIRAVN